MFTLIYSALTFLGLFESAEQFNNSSDFFSSITPWDNFTSTCDQVPEGFVDLPKDDSLHEGVIEWWFSFGHLIDERGRNIDYVYVVPKFFASGIPFLIAESGIFIDDKLEYEITTHFTQPEKVENGFKFDFGHVKLEGGDGYETIHLKAGDYQLDLEATQSKAPIFYFNDGYLEMNYGGYFNYYSRPRSKVNGVLTQGDESYKVAGISYFDHQFGVMDELVSFGWNFFMMHLDNGTDIIIFLIKAGNSEVWISDENCNFERMDSQDIDIKVTDKWVSPLTGCTWPHGWKFGIKGKEYVVTPAIDDCEWNNPFKIRWQGPIVVSGDATGRGEAELVGGCHD
jgi:predicted secreted hydrolase